MKRSSLPIPLVAILAVALVGSEPNAKEPAGFLVLPYLQLPTPDGITVMWETKADLPSRVEYGLTRKLGSHVEIKKATALHEVRLKGLKPSTTYYYRVRSKDVVSDNYSFKTAPPLGTRRWRMAVYGDSRSNPRMHRKVTEQIARAKVDLIVHTGDIVINGKIHQTWRLEFFGPLGSLARSVPWVSTIGNHERDSEHYFSYMALPGNERYFSFDFANAQIVCLDSNAWIARDRDSKQYQWAQDHLKKKRNATWTFVAFHHPLFSAHATRPINPLRWDWAPLLLDPANRVDGVLTGHDHFYARNYRMGRLQHKPQQGVLFLTTAGGGAHLYPCKERDYVAREKSVHHFTLFDFDGDKVQVSAIDIDGKVFDRYELTKKPTPADQFCAYEVEELRRYLRLALARANPIRPASGEKATTIDTELRVPTRFQVPVAGELRWEKAGGWTMKNRLTKFRLKPGQPLVIPLEAEVRPGAEGKSPALTISFEDGKFRNRIIQVYPFKMAGPTHVTLKQSAKPLTLTGDSETKAWRNAKSHPLLLIAPELNRSKEAADQVQFLANRDWLYVRAVLSDPEGRVKVPKPDPSTEGSRLVLVDEHVRLILSDGKKTRVYAVSPDSVRYFTVSGEEDENNNWRAVVTRNREAWIVQMAIPRKVHPNLEEVFMNVVHHRREAGSKPKRKYVDFELCPTYVMGSDPDRLPDWKPGNTLNHFARLRLK
jgi:hypothetical protein